MFKSYYIHKFIGITIVVYLDKVIGCAHLARRRSAFPAAFPSPSGNILPEFSLPRKKPRRRSSAGAVVQICHLPFARRLDHGAAAVCFSLTVAQIRNVLMTTAPRWAHILLHCASILIRFVTRQTATSA